MFTFGSSRKDNIFEIADIRELVLTFPHKAALDDSEHSEPGDLVPLASNEGFVQFKALAKELRKLLDGKYGTIPVTALAKHLDVNAEVLLRLAREDDDVMLSRNGDSVLTRCEQKRFAEALQNVTLNAFISAEEFSQRHDVSREDIPKILRHCEQSSTEPPLQLLPAPGKDVNESDETGYPYIHTLATLLKMKGLIVEKVKQSTHDARPVSWSDFLGLSRAAFRRLAQSILNSEDDTDSLQGYFEGGENEVRFVPRSYLLRKATKEVKEVALGTLPFCDLKQLTQRFPTLLPDSKAARKFVETACHDKHGAPYEFHFVADKYAVGDSSLNNTANKCLHILGTQRTVDTKPYLHSFPETIREDVQKLLTGRTGLLFRSLGGDLKDYQIRGSHVIQSALIGDLEFVSQRLAKQVVEEQWKEQTDISPSQNALAAPEFIERLREESDLGLDLLRRLWVDTEHGIYLAAKTTYEQRLTELRTENQAKFMAFWISRVSSKAHLHSAGLEALEEGPLKEQLKEILAIYISKDLILANIKRARTKGLVRTQLAQKNVSKLEEALAADKKDKTAPVDALAKFNKKMGIDSNAEDLVAAKKEYLQEIVQSMQKEADGPRLFLGVVVNLFASKRQGVLYATGKFAPRLLKLLKADLDAAQSKRLEEIKEAVKAGTVDEGIREEMRTMVKDAIEA